MLRRRLPVVPLATATAFWAAVPILSLVAVPVTNYAGRTVARFRRYRQHDQCHPTTAPATAAAAVVTMQRYCCDADCCCCQSGACDAAVFVGAGAGGWSTSVVRVAE